MNTKEELIEYFKLIEHPEGGYYKEYYRSYGEYDLSKLPDFSGKRNYSTAIYYLLDWPNKSAPHKIKSDEIWHFYSGAPLILYKITLSGRLEKITLGIGPDKTPSAVVLAGEIMFAECSEPEAYSFVGCTVAPGFDFLDFTFVDNDKIVRDFPDLKIFMQNYR